MRRAATFLMLLLLVLCTSSAAVAAQGRDSRYLLSASSYKALSHVNELMQKDRYREAVKELQLLLPQVADRAYDSAVTLQTLGYAYYSLKEDNKAIDAFRKALNHHALPPKVSRSLTYNLAQLLIYKQRFKEGLAYLDGWLKESKHPPADAYVMAASAAYGLKRYRQTIGYLHKAMARSTKPNESWDQMLLACYYRLDRYKDAAALLERMVRRYPEKKTYWMQLVGTYQRLKDDQRALAVMQLAQTRGLLDPDETIQLVHMYLYLKMPYRGAQLLAQEMQRGHVAKTRKHWELLADGWLLAQEKQKAAEALEHAAQLGGGPEIEFKLGQVRFQLQDWAKAAKALERATSGKGLKHPGVANLLLGIAQYHLGHPQQALDALTQARYQKQTRDQAEWWANKINSEKDGKTTKKHSADE